MNNTMEDSAILNISKPDDFQFYQDMPMIEMPSAQLRNTVDLMSKFYVPVMIALGISGNVLMAVGLLIRSQKGIECANFMGAKAVSDALYLVAYTFLWLTEYKVNLYHTKGWCQFFTFINGATGFLSIWYVVCICIERFVTLAFPMSRSKVCSTIKVKVTVIGLATVAVPVYLNMSLTTAVDEEYRMCSRHRWFISAIQFLMKIDAFVNVVFPSMVILTLTCFNFIRVCMLCTKRRQILKTGRGTDANTLFNGEIRTSTVALLVCFANFALCFPSNYYRVSILIKTMTGAQFMPTPKIAYIQRLLMHISNTSYMINIFIYPWWTFYRSNMLNLLAKMKAWSGKICVKKPPVSSSIEEEAALRPAGPK